MLPAICRVSGNDVVFQQDSAPAHCTAHVHQWTAASRNSKLSCMHATCGLQTAQISVLGIMRSGLSCSIMSTAHNSMVLMNWNCGSSMFGAGLNRRFLTRLLTSGKEDIERVSVLKEDISSTDCELTMLILSTSITFTVTCLTVTSLIMKSCRQRWPIHSCSFYKVLH